MKPKVTVLMSCYNGQRWVGDAIESVLSQTYENFEFFIIDDGSKDGTLEIINGYAKKDSRITVFAKSNTGLSNSLNIGILKANGQWIARLDQDDLCEPRRLELQLEYVESHPDVILLGTDFIEINENDKVLKSHTYPSKHQRLVHNLLRCKRFFPHSSAFYRTEIARETGGYRQQVRHSEDHDLWLRISEYGQLACLNIPLIRFRTHSSQATLEEGGRIAMINSRAAKVCFLLRKSGCFDPLETDPDKRAEFTSWLEKRLSEEGVFERKEVWSSARNTFFHSQNRLFGGIQFTGKLFTYKHVFALMKEKFFGSDLPERLAQEWKKNACTTP